MLARSATLFNQSNIDANGHADTWPGAGARVDIGYQVQTLERTFSCVSEGVPRYNNRSAKALFATTEYNHRKQNRAMARPTVIRHWRLETMPKRNCTPDSGEAQDIVHNATNEIPPKRCTKCGEEFPATLEYFRKQRNGLRAECKVCERARKQLQVRNPTHERERKRRWYQQNVDRVRERVRQYRLANPEKVREGKRRWAHANPEWAREYKRRYRAENADQEREQGRRWRQANPERVRGICHRRRARRLSLPATFTVEHERLALEYFNGCCAVCGRQLRDLLGTHTAAMDHWIPLKHGGGSTPDNMIPLCHGIGGCNNRKHDSNPTEWLASRYSTSQAKKILARIEAYFAWVKSLEGGAS